MPASRKWWPILEPIKPSDGWVRISDPIPKYRVNDLNANGRIRKPPGKWTFQQCVHGLFARRWSDDAQER